MKPLVSSALAGSVLCTCLYVGTGAAVADNKRLNDSVIQAVNVIQYRSGCFERVVLNPQLQLAAEWHANDVLQNRALSGDIGSDGSTVQSRAAAAGFAGPVSQTVAINPALSITGVEILNQWFQRPGDLATMSNCAFKQMGVWSVNSLDRTVVVAVYGQPS